MPIKYIPFIPEPVEGQAVLGNFNRILLFNTFNHFTPCIQIFVIKIYCRSDIHCLSSPCFNVIRRRMMLPV